MSFKTRKIKYLMNLKIEKNFISQALIKNAQLFNNIKFLLKMQIINKRIIISYNI